jgi:hypothetical protein
MSRWIIETGRSDIDYLDRNVNRLPGTRRWGGLFHWIPLASKHGSYYAVTTVQSENEQEQDRTSCGGKRDVRTGLASPKR